MTQERVQSVFESPEAIKMAAELAGIDTAQMTMTEIRKAIIEAGELMVRAHEKILPENYRRIKVPPFVSPLALSVVMITIESLDK
jgi:hypothetical protein